MSRASHRLAKLWRYFVWFTSIVIAIVSLRILVLGMDVGYPQLMHHFPDRVVLFWSHVIAASIALLLMPFQFWKGLRSRRAEVHRWMGRIYVVCVAVGGISGALLAPFASTGAIAAWGFFLLAVFWLVITTQAVRLALHRRFEGHRRWMIRSAALTFAAVTLRIWLPLSMVAEIPFGVAYPMIAWLCWVPNFLLAELYLARIK